MSLDVHFDTGSSSAEIRIKGPAFVGQPVSLVRQFVSDRTADGTRYTYHLTNSTKWEWELQFRDLAREEKRELEEFFRAHARGPSQSFTYTHTDGTVYAGTRFAQDILPWTRNHRELWDCTVRIETLTEPN